MDPISFMCNFTIILLKLETHGRKERNRNMISGTEEANNWKLLISLYKKTENAYGTFYQMFWTDVMPHRFIDQIVSINCQ